MRLIDADALDMYERLKSYYGMAWRDAQEEIDAQPTVDAIPISWLEQHIKDAETLLWLEYARHLKSLLYTWNEKK